MTHDELMAIINESVAFVNSLSDQKKREMIDAGFLDRRYDTGCKHSPCQGELGHLGKHKFEWAEGHVTYTPVLKKSTGFRYCHCGDTCSPGHCLNVPA